MMVVVVQMALMGPVQSLLPSWRAHGKWRWRRMQLVVEEAERRVGKGQQSVGACWSELLLLLCGIGAWIFLAGAVEQWSSGAVEV